MSSGLVTPVVPNANDVLLGEGTTYINYGEAGEAIIGATQGGSKFEIEKKTINVKVDGAYGDIKGLKRIDVFIPKLIINFLKLNYTTLGYGVPSTVTTTSTYKEFAFRLNIEATDILKNVAFIGQKHDGKACKIIVENCLNDGNIALAFKEKVEVVSEMQFTGHYLYAYPVLPPFSVRDYDV